jgi:tetratricopeptide (TPR) repeat protein
LSDLGSLEEEQWKFPPLPEKIRHERLRWGNFLSPLPPLRVAGSPKFRCPFNRFRPNLESDPSTYPIVGLSAGTAALLLIGVALYFAVAGDKLLTRSGSTADAFRSKRGTDNEEAYQSYQQAMTLLDQQRPGSMDKAREYLERAVELDPNYAKAWAGKAYAYSIMWGAGRPSDPENPFDKYARSMEAVNRALAIDPNISEAYTSICENKFAYEFNFDEAEKNCKRAIDLDPNSPLAHRLYSMLLTSRGRSEEAFAEIKTAIDLDPVSLRNQRIFANALYYARRYEEAIEAYKRLYDLNPRPR